MCWLPTILSLCAAIYGCATAAPNDASIDDALTQLFGHMNSTCDGAGLTDTSLAVPSFAFITDFYWRVWPCNRRFDELPMGRAFHLDRETAGIFLVASGQLFIHASAAFRGKNRFDFCAETPFITAGYSPYGQSSAQSQSPICVTFYIPPEAPERAPLVVALRRNSGSTSFHNWMMKVHSDATLTVLGPDGTSYCLARFSQAVDEASRIPLIEAAPNTRAVEPL